MCLTDDAPSQYYVRTTALDLGGHASFVLREPLDFVSLRSAHAYTLENVQYSGRDGRGKYDSKYFLREMSPTSISI
jgi:hypothetical protein